MRLAWKSIINLWLTALRPFHPIPQQQAVQCQDLSANHQARIISYESSCYVNCKEERKAANLSKFWSFKFGHSID